MSFIINDNNFSLDDYALRGRRLEFLSKSIGSYATELSVTGDLLTWALNSYNLFEAARTNGSIEDAVVNVEYQNFQISLEQLINRYQILKNILKSNFHGEPDKYEVLGILGKTPRTKAGIFHACEVLTGGNAKLKELGNTNVLPESKIEEFQDLLEETKEKELLAKISNEKSKNSTKELHKIFDDDTVKLRAVYNLAVAVWGRFDTKLIGLGFVQAKEIRRSKKAEIPANIVFDEQNKTMSWNESEGATSYQIAFTEAEKSKWRILYAGKSNKYIFKDTTENIKIKLRTRNKNGFGKWSEEIPVNG